MAQPSPMTVCLYFVLICLSVRKYSSSRYSHMSFKPSSQREPCGRRTFTLLLAIIHLR